MGAAAAAARRRRRASSQPAETPFTRLRVQDPGEHGSAASRPDRVLPRLLGPLPAGDEGAPPAHRPRDEARQRADVHGERARRERGRGRRRHHRHPQPRPAADRRHADRRRSRSRSKGIPYFAPELFRVARPRDPFKAKPLPKGLQELGEEGAIQVFASSHTQHAAARAPSARCSSRSSRSGSRANTRSTRSTRRRTSRPRAG